MFEARKNIIDLFKGGTFPYKGDLFKTKNRTIEGKIRSKRRIKRRIGRRKI